MKRISTTIIFLIAYMFIFFLYPAYSNDDFIARNLKTFKSFTLKNNINVHIKSDNESRINSLVILIEGGKAVLPEEKAGLDRATLNVLTMESKNYSDTRRRSLLKRTSASISSSDGLDYSTYQMKTIDTYFDDVFSLYADLFLNPLFSEKHLIEVKTDLVNAYNAEMSDGYARVSRAVNTEFFKNHPYLSFLMTPDTVDSITRDDVINYYKKNILDPSRITIFAVGNYDLKKLNKKLNATLGKIAPKNKCEKPEPENFHDISSPELIIDIFDDLKDGTSYIRGNFKIAAPTDNKYWATVLGMNILSDVLSDLVRTKNNLAYSVWAYPYSRKSNYANISVYRTNNPASAFELIAKSAEVVLSGRCLSPFNQTEDGNNYVEISQALDFYKASFSTSFYSGLQDNTSIAIQMANSYSMTGDFTSYLYVKKNIDSIKPEEVIEALKSQLVPTEIQWAVTSPPETAKTLE